MTTAFNDKIAHMNMAGVIEMAPRCVTQKPFTRKQSSVAKIGWLVFSLLMPLASIAETVYVGDTLRVGVRNEPGSRTASLAVVPTGTALDVIERRGGYMKVRTPGGVEGWVKSAYMTHRKPAKLLLVNARSKINQLEKELKTLRRMQPGQNIQQEALAETIERLEAEKATLERQINSGDRSVSQMHNTGAVLNVGEYEVNPKVWISALAIFLICVGFLVGVTWHKNQVTKRLGGLTL
jgi:hypothetical protein